MPTSQKTIEYLLDQIPRAGEVRARKMFGEYALYCNDTVVGLVCDDQLYVKPTEAGRSFIGHVSEAPPYPGAKNYFQIDESQLDQREWLSQLIRITAAWLSAKK